MSGKKADVIGLSITMEIAPEYQGENHPLLANQVHRTVKTVGHRAEVRAAIDQYDKEKTHGKESSTLGARTNDRRRVLGKTRQEAETA